MLMNSLPEWNDLKINLKTFLIWGLSSFIDLLFLTLWVVAQWLSHYLISLFPLTGFDNYIVAIFQVIFGISTLIPILAYVASDLAKIVLQARRSIIMELRKSDEQFSIIEK